MNEYQMLRDEIMENIKQISQHITILYTATAALLAFALQTSEFLLPMIPYTVIVPLLLRSEALTNTNCRIAAYMIVFLEGVDNHWETRLYENEKGRKRTKRYLLPYYFISLTCTVSSLYKLIFGNYLYFYKWLWGICIIILSIILFVIMIANTVNIKKKKGEYIKQWQEMKEGKTKNDVRLINKSKRMKK